MKSIELRSIAISLRREGYSYKEIATKLTISKSTAFIWVKDIQLSAKGIRRINNLVDDARLRSGRTKFLTRQQQLIEIQKSTRAYLKSWLLDGKPDLLLCSLLYWCEGAKQDVTVKFTNADPGLIKTFLKLFRSAFAIDERKLRVTMHLHGYHDIEGQGIFWSTITGISLVQFHKPYIKPNTGKSQKIGYPGCICINYGDSKIARRLLQTAQIFMQQQ